MSQDEDKLNVPSSARGRNGTNLPSNNIPSSSSSARRSYHQTREERYFGQRQRSGYYLFFVNYNHITYQIKISPECRIIDLMQKLCKVTHIPVHRQELKGWPVSITRDGKYSKLKHLNLNFKTTLVLTSIEDELKERERSSTPSSLSSLSPANSKSSSPSYDADLSANSLQNDNNNPQIVQDPSASIIQQNLHLISDKIEDEKAGVMEFIRNYMLRYNRLVPTFFQGTLEDAKNEAFKQPIKNKKLLAILVYNGHSDHTDYFCNHVLSFGNNMSLLNDNCVLYGWDITFESNRNFLLSCAMLTIGETTSSIIRNTPVNNLPAIVFIGNCNNAVCDVLNVIHSNVGIRNFKTRILEIVDLYNGMKDNENRENEERLQREIIKHEQDIEYQKSLEADKAKENAKKLKEIELKEEQKRLELENLKNQKERQNAKSLLPKEPNDSVEKANIVKIKIRTNSLNEFLERKFYRTDKIQDLFNYLISEGFSIEKYKILRWPRHDLTTVDPNLTFNCLKMNSNETLFLEKR